MGILLSAAFILVGIGIQRFLLDPRGFLGDGALIICENSERIFLISAGLKHALPDNLELAQELGFKLDKIVEVSCEFQDLFPEGATVEELLQSEAGQQILAKRI